MDIKVIIKQGESEISEFKEKFDNETIETVVAFANAKGGIILIGVSDNGEVRGIKIGKDTVERITNKILQTTDPKIYPKISVRKIKNKKIVIVEVEESKNKPYFVFGGAFKRVGKSSVKMSKGEIEKLILEREKIYWDEQICKGASLKDIDEKKVKWFLRKAKYERNFDIETETPVKEVLGRLELMKNVKLTNAAILLFGKNPQKFFYQAETRCARFKGTEPIKFTDMKVFQGTILEQVEKALNFVLDHIPMRVEIKGKPEREEKYEYPPYAIREAVVNAICHRNYSIASNVQVRIFDDRIEVWGVGPLPEPLTPEDLKKKHKSILRNPLIGKCFFLIKFIEQWGTGTNRMIEACLKHGLPEPKFEEAAGSLVVTFRKYRTSDEELEKLNERQRKAVEFLKEHGRITLSEYRNLNPNATEKTAYRDLKRMEKLGMIKGIGKKKGRYYVLV